jgi:phosphate-selective porin OprO/OprP
MKTFRFLAGALLAVSHAPAAHENTTEPGAEPKWTTLFANDDVQVKFFGRIQLDGVFSEGDPSYDDDDGVEFRRARIGFSGTLYELVDFKAEYDFAGGDADFTDVYMEADELCFGAGLVVGHFKEPMSLEELTSSRFITFAERSLMNALSPARNVGIMLHDFYEPGFGWAAGAFRDTDGFGSDNTTDDDAERDNEYAYTARVHGQLWNRDEGASVLHLGASYSFRKADDSVVSFSTRPEAHLIPTVASTGSIPSSDTQLAGAEVAWVEGPLSIQGELMHAAVDGWNVPDGDFIGYYGEVSYFLTGEHRNYKAGEGKFDRIKPLENKTKGGGKGAWMIAGRYSKLDLDDGPSDDSIENYTAGVTWILNPNTRIVLNFIHSQFEEGSVDDSADIGVIRFQVDW